LTKGERLFVDMGMVQNTLTENPALVSRYPPRVYAVIPARVGVFQDQVDRQAIIAGVLRSSAARVRKDQGYGGAGGATGASTRLPAG
jgi:hypothetical protein